MRNSLLLAAFGVILSTGTNAFAGGFLCNFVEEGGSILIAGQTAADFTSQPSSWAPGHFTLSLDIQDKAVMALSGSIKAGRGALLESLIGQISGNDEFKRSYFVSKSCSVTIDPAPVLAELLEVLEGQNILTMCSIDEGDPTPAAATAEALRHLRNGVVKLDCFYAHK